MRSESNAMETRGESPENPVRDTSHSTSKIKKIKKWKISSKKEKRRSKSEEQLIPDPEKNKQTGFSTKSPSLQYQHLPPLEVVPILNPWRTTYAEGPSETHTRAMHHKEVYACAESTYPHMPGKQTREGDPVCDHFSFQVYSNRLAVCLADGCSWGERSRAAAKSATEGFQSFMAEHQSDITDIKKAGAVLLSAFENSHKTIMAGKIQQDAGTTTLLGGVLLQVNKGDDLWAPPWIFVCASVGDCKAYCLSNGEVSEITNFDRMDVTIAGGSLGPCTDEGKPDLGNLNLFAHACSEDDIVILVTDGVHDNLDPDFCGKLPHDMPKEFNLSESENVWEKLEAKKVFAAKNAYAKQLLEQLLMDCTEPSEVGLKLVNYCINITKKSRDQMEKEGKRLPKDHVEWPGKMDHTSCLCFRVGCFELP